MGLGSGDGRTGASNGGRVARQVPRAAAATLIAKPGASARGAASILMSNDPNPSVAAAPAYDPSDVTAINAHRVVLETLSGIALRRSGGPAAPELDGRAR